MKVDEIVEYILKRIEKEDYKKGEKIESENQLCQRFSVSRMTVRKAIENLVQRNYLYREHGKGTFVKDNANKISVFLNEIIGFNERAKKYNLKAETKILNSKIIKADKNLSERLKITKNSMVHCIEKLRLINSEPVVYEISYISKEYLSSNEINYFSTAKSEYISSKNIKIKKMEKEFIGIIPDYRIRKKLKMKDLVPVFKQEVLTFTGTEKPFDFTVTFYNQDRYKFIEIIQK